MTYQSIGRVIGSVGGRFTVYLHREGEGKQDTCPLAGKTVVAQARGVLRRRGELLVGDLVEVRYDDSSFSLADGEAIPSPDGTAIAVERICERKNALIRPPMANLDVLFVTLAAASPDPVLGSDDYTDGGELDELTPYTSELKALLPNTTYYFRAYVINEVGISYGETVSFKTLRDESLNPTSGLYAYYTFENSTANTVEGAPNATGISTTYSTGVGDSYGLKLSANGESYLNIGEAMIDTKFFTVSFWIKGIGDGLIFRVLPSSSASYRAISHAMAVINGKIKYSQSGYMWQYREYEDQVFPPFLHNTLSSSSWHHIALTSDFISGYDDVVAKLYINGEYVDTVTLGQEGSTNGFGTKFIFGGNFNNSYLTLSALSMTIDNLRIYNTRVLSAQEIRNIYNYEK